jgi:hypothetical protein
MAHSVKVVVAVGLVSILPACAAGASAPNPSVALPLSLSWSTATQGPSTSATAALGAPGSVTIIPSGTSPFQASIAGNCATVAPTTTTTSFVANVSSGFCAIVVQDGAARVRAIELLGPPPRAFLNITPSGLVDATGTVRLSVGSSLNLSVDEPLVGSSFNAPYSATIQGACATISSTSAQQSGPAKVSLTATAVGQCVAVFADAAGQATVLNLTVS